MAGCMCWRASVPLILCAMLVLGHRKLTALSRRPDRHHLRHSFHARPALVLAVEFGLWELSGALPSAVACLQFVALRLVVTRLPLVPNKDLIFVGAGIAAAGMANMAVTPVATVLVILAAADLMLAASVASFAWLLDSAKDRRDERLLARNPLFWILAAGGGSAAGGTVLGPAGVRRLGR